MQGTPIATTFLFSSLRPGSISDPRTFLVKLQELVKDRPFDVVNLVLHVPTVQGSLEKTPSFMAFEVTSTPHDDIQAFLPEVRTLIRNSDLVLVSEKKA